jgi:heme-degrading monooxygenase HmoA
MYAALVNYPVKPGYLDEAIRFWREELEPAAEGQPGYLGSVLLFEREDNRLVVVAYWDTRTHDDAFATTGPWRAGSELRNKMDALLSEEPSRVETEVAYPNAPQSL